MADELLKLLDADQKRIVASVRANAGAALDHTPRFKYFTLHGSPHIATMFEVANLLIRGGLSLNREEAFFLAVAICVHDLGMVASLREAQEKDLFQGMPQAPDPALTEAFIREHHHDLIDAYVAGPFSAFLTGLGIEPPAVAIIKEIARAHRRINIRQQQGLVRPLGALLRVIDELDVCPARAPAVVLRNTYKEMDATSCWHWFKHNIVETWVADHNVVFVTVGKKRRIEFRLAVHPPTILSQSYWLNQVRRPITKALIDEGAAHEIRERWNVLIGIEPAQELSTPNDMGKEWAEIEQVALTGMRKVVLVIDDEVRKMTDLFLPLMDKYHIVFSATAADALTKMTATKVHLAVIDMQLGSGGLWTPEQTQEFKATGLKLVAEIKDRFPETTIGVLTGTRYELGDKLADEVAFLLKKPVDPEILEKRVTDVLR